MRKHLRIVSRKSALALWQANFVKKQLETIYPDLEISIQGISTEGDQNLNSSLAKIGGKGLFVKALEDCLLNHQADIAVHSLKDMPVTLPEGLEIAVVLQREDPRDALVSLNFANLQELPFNAIVGTSSLRRQLQLHALRSDLKLNSLRGNVETRLQKLERREYDAIILAVAGLKRLNLNHHIREYFSPEIMLPAIGQGALTIECRKEDEETKKLIIPLHHLPSAYCVFAERSMNAYLGGSCVLPISGLATLNNEGILKLQGMIVNADASQILKAESSGNPEDRIAIGQEVAQQLLAKGAKKIIDEFR